MINPNTDTHAVLEFLRDYGSINERQALMELGVKRLSARIKNIKEDGYTVTTKLKKIEKRSGRMVNVTDMYIFLGRGNI